MLVLGDVVGDLLPSALAVALSPIPIVAVVLVLGSPRARTAGPAFLLGWIAGLASVGALVLLLLSGGADADADDPGVSWLKLGIGLLFLAMAARLWRKRPPEGGADELPGWMATVDSATAPKAAALGLTLSAANPKNLALTLAATASIAEAGLDPVDEAVATAVFVAIGSATVAAAVLSYLILGDRANGPLASVRRFMAAHNAAIMIVVLVLLGVKLVGDALGGLS